MVPSKPPTKQTWALSLLALLMIAHMLFLVFASRHCYELIEANPKLETRELLCDEPSETFQEAAETYIALLLALMAPIGTK